MPDSDIRRLDAASLTRVVPFGTVWRSWGSGPHLVLLHGSAGSWTHWIRNIAALSQTHTVHAPDLPGCGESALPSAPGTLQEVARMVVAGLDTIAPDTRFDLAGFSLGSVIAEQMAVAFPARIRSLALLRGLHDGSTPSLPAGLQRWRDVSDDAALAAHRHNLALTMFYDSRAIDDQAVHLHAANARRFRLDMRPLLASRGPDTLRCIAAPLLAIAGQFDAYAGAAVEPQGKALLAAAPHAQWHVVAGAGHWVNYEAAVECNRILLAWLNDDA